MTRTFAILFAVTASLAAVSPAAARGGCGLGWHPGPLGVCHPNTGGPVVVAPVVVAPGGVAVVPAGRVCPLGYHLGPYGHCRLN